MNRMSFLIGLPFGFLLVVARFTDYDVIHDGLLLRDPTIYLVMASTVATSLLLLWLLERWNWRTRLGGPLRLKRLQIEKKHVIGGLVFGTGWPLGLVVMAGIFCGVLLPDLLIQSGVRGKEAPGRPPAL
jgi:hypothetical protein